MGGQVHGNPAGHSLEKPCQLIQVDECVAVEVDSWK